MKLAIILFTALLVGCAATPVKRNFPDAPEELKVSCQDLQKVQDNAKLSDVVATVTTNYGQYHECRIKLDAWNQWYSRQREIFESVK
jgi:predicted metallo-beta-lactamase superfamily hydrolase